MPTMLILKKFFFKKWKEDMQRLHDMMLRQASDETEQDENDNVIRRG